MKSSKEISKLRSAMFKATHKYHQAIVESLKEYGKELDVINDDWSVDDDYPRGVKVTSINDDGDGTFSVVVDKIRYEESEPVCKVGIHVVWYDYSEIDQWWGLNDLTGEAADYVMSCIEWPEDMEMEDEPEKIYVFTAEQAWDGEVADIIVKTFRTRTAAQEYMHKFIHESEDDESIVDYVKRKDWYVEMDEPNLYRACEDGRYATDHIEITITECNME